MKTTVKSGLELELVGLKSKCEERRDGDQDRVSLASQLLPAPLSSAVPALTLVERRNSHAVPAAGRRAPSPPAVLACIVCARL